MEDTTAHVSGILKYKLSLADAWIECFWSPINGLNFWVGIMHWWSAFFFFKNFSKRKNKERATDLIYCAFIDLFHFINCKFGAMEIYGLKILAIFFSNA